MELKPEQEQILNKLVYEDLFYFGRDKLFKYIQANFPESGISRRMVSAWTERQEVYQRTKVVPKRADTRQINISKEGFVNIDLVGPMHEERGYLYCLTLLDLGTRRLFMRPIKQKTSVNIREAFKQMVAEEQLKVSVVKSDNDQSFKDEFLAYLNESGIKTFYSPPAKPWQNPVERYHRSMKQSLYKYELATGLKNWVQPLQTIIKNLNNTWQRTLRSTPNESKDLPDEVRLQRLKDYGTVKRRNNGKTAFRLGDVVRKRIPKSSTFEKQKEYFSAETYIVSGINRGNNNRLVTYKLSEDGQKHIVGVYNITDLLLVSASEAPNREVLDPDDIQVGARTKHDQREVNALQKHTEEVSEVRDTRHPQPDAKGFYVVERILSRRKFGKIWKYETKWRGFDSSYNTFQTARELSGAKELLKEFQENMKKKR